MPEVASQLSPKTPRPNSGTLAAVVRSHAAVLFRRAMSLTHRHADACDLVQDALLRALDHDLEGVPPEKLCNWLFVVMSNLHIDRRRSASRRTIVELDEAQLAPVLPSDPPEEPPWRTIEIEDVRQCLSGLNPRVREAYALHEEEGLSLADTARRLSVPVATAGTRVFRARRRLREMLKASGAPF